MSHGNFYGHQILGNYYDRQYNRRTYMWGTKEEAPPYIAINPEKSHVQRGPDGKHMVKTETGVLGYINFLGPIGSSCNPPIRSDASNADPAFSASSSIDRSFDASLGQTC